MQLCCASPAQYQEFEGVESIYLETDSVGRIGILRGHAPLVTRLKDSSTVVIKVNKAEQKLQLQGASFFAVTKNQAKISTIGFQVE